MEALPSRLNLCKRRIVEDPICVVRGREGESTTHIMGLPPSSWCVVLGFKEVTEVSAVPRGVSVGGMGVSEDSVI